MFQTNAWIVTLSILRPRLFAQHCRAYKGKTRYGRAWVLPHRAQGESPRDGPRDTQKYNPTTHHSRKGATIARSHTETGITTPLGPKDKNTVQYQPLQVLGVSGRVGPPVSQAVPAGLDKEAADALLQALKRHRVTLISRPCTGV
jgi:hypothetical protein